MVEDKNEILMPTRSEVKVIPPARIDYTNHRNERSVRVINPIRIYYGSTHWHPEDQWLLAAWDMEKNADRIFAMKNVHAWDWDPIACPPKYLHQPIGGRQDRIDKSISAQLQQSMERNARMVNRLKKLQAECNDFEPRKTVIDDIDCILKDEDF